MSINGKKTVLGAHRLAWLVAHGDIPLGMFVCHKCDNPPCVNPAHLFLGTASDNAIDREAKGRAAWRKGEHSPNPHLTRAQVEAIRAEWSMGHVSQSSLARKYGTSQGNISRIVHRQAWA